MDASGGTTLAAKQLYHVNACIMREDGSQTLNLTGTSHIDWYNASRFVRVADPCHRAWPSQ